MYYEQAQAIMDDNMSQEDRKQFPDYDMLRKELLKFLELSDHINVCTIPRIQCCCWGGEEGDDANVNNLTQNKRVHKGALVLASTETRFELGENKTPTKINILIVFFVFLFPSPIFLSLIAIQSPKRTYLSMPWLQNSWFLPPNTWQRKSIRCIPPRPCCGTIPFPERKASSLSFDALRYFPPISYLPYFLINLCLLIIKAKGFSIDISSNKALADSLDQAVVPSDPSVNFLLRQLATQAMAEAQYVLPFVFRGSLISYFPIRYFSTGAYEVSEFFHYGLALDKYTHFTYVLHYYSPQSSSNPLFCSSPIRRYAGSLPIFP